MPLTANYILTNSLTDDHSLSESGAGNKDKSDMNPIFVKLPSQRGDESEIDYLKATLFSILYARQLTVSCQCSHCQLTLAGPPS